MLTVQQFAKGNMIPQQYSANAQMTVNIVNEVFDAFPNRFRFTSGYRTPAQNRAANGVTNSFHLTAEAADFVPNNGQFPGGEKSQLLSVVGKYGYEVVLHNVGSGLHYHIEPSPSGKRVPESDWIINVGTIGTVDVPIPKDGDFLGDMAQTIGVSKSALGIGLVVLVAAILKP